MTASLVCVPSGRASDVGVQRFVARANAQRAKDVVYDAPTVRMILWKTQNGF